MINSTLIIPTENPTTIDDLKRAIVTFDKVFLPSPEDREFIPFNIHDNVRMHYKIWYLKSMQIRKYYNTYL